MEFKQSERDGIKYYIFDPSKNITALVKSEVEILNYSEIAKRIMEKEPTVEQVGFLKLNKKEDSDKSKMTLNENETEANSVNESEKCDIELRMAGGEFCGNATMSVAAFYCMDNDLLNGNVKVKVYSVEEIINVQIKKIAMNEWEGIVLMPRVIEIKKVTFPNGKTFPVVFFSSIAHIIITTTDNDIKSKIVKEEVESLIREWCDFLKVPALGFIYYNFQDSSLVPLVYVKSAKTLFWESSCASGSYAVGVWLIENYKNGVYKNLVKISDENNFLALDINQPSEEVLTIICDDKDNIYLKGRVRYNCELIL